MDHIWKDVKGEFGQVACETCGVNYMFKPRPECIIINEYEDGLTFF